jgi:hypothetical protein
VFNPVELSMKNNTKKSPVSSELDLYRRCADSLASALESVKEGSARHARLQTEAEALAASRQVVLAESVTAKDDAPPG